MSGQEACKAAHTHMMVALPDSLAMQHMAWKDMICSVLVNTASQTGMFCCTHAQRPLNLTVCDRLPSTLQIAARRRTSLHITLHAPVHPCCSGMTGCGCPCHSGLRGRLTSLVRLAGLGGCVRGVLLPSAAGGCINTVPTRGSGGSPTTTLLLHRLPPGGDCNDADAACNQDAEEGAQAP